MASGFDDIFAELTSINAEQAMLSERLRMLEGPTPAPGPSGVRTPAHLVGEPVRWDDLPPAKRAKLWPEFVAWVIWLADRYELTTDQVPRQCWWRHGAVVEELTALWTSHQSAYAADMDGGSAPYLWQDALGRAIERIGRYWLGTCRNGQHKDRHREAWNGDEAYLADLLAADKDDNTR